MGEISGILGGSLVLSEVVQYKLIVSVAVVIILLLLRRIAVFLLSRRIKDATTLYRWRKTATYISFFIGIIIIGRTWVVGFSSLSTFLGLASAGITIALKDPIVNIAGWAFILWRRPIEMGDRIQVGDHKGDVIDIRVFQFSILEVGNWVDADQSTGRIINIPNGKVFTETLVNYTTGFEYIWNEMPVLLTFESDWEKTKKILDKIAKKRASDMSEDINQKIRQAQKKFMIQYSTVAPSVYTSVKDSGVLLTIRYMTSARSRRETEQTIWEDILREFAKHDDIDYAYPTQRRYDNITEGKPGARADGPSQPD
jgi:small-conductance mechanosensitive channel